MCRPSPLSLLRFALLASGVILGGAGSGGCAPAPDSSSADSEPPLRPVVVSVAASAREVMEQLGAEFGDIHGIEVRINAGATSTLAHQILQGAPADLFLAANREWAERLDQAGFVRRSQPLLTNDLVLVTAAGNPSGLRGPDDLTGKNVSKVALAGENVPAGIYAQQALTHGKLFEPLVAAGKIVRGQDVRSTLGYVERGEAEAAIVYSTDVRAAREVTIVSTFDRATHDEIAYVLVQVRAAQPSRAADQFFEFLQSESSLRAFAAAGFRPLDALPAEKTRP